MKEEWLRISSRNIASHPDETLGFVMIDWKMNDAELKESCKMNPEHQAWEEIEFQLNSNCKAENDLEYEIDIDECIPPNGP